MMDVEVLELIQFAKHLVINRTQNPLDQVQEAILRQALLGAKLKEIRIIGYSENTVQTILAPNLWKLLSDATGEKVGIKTVRLILQELFKKQDTFNSSNQPLEKSQETLNFELELPGGQVNLSSPFYIERPPIESQAYEEIIKPGSLIRIKGPKQMGKTSLMARLLNHAQRQGCRTVVVNFELTDNEVFADLNRFLRRFCAMVADDLQLPMQLNQYWDEELGSKNNCTNYFARYLLPTLGQPLVLGLDAVDRIFQHEKIADDFFGLLRAWHEKSKQIEIWKNLHLIIAHGTEVYIPLDIHQSPFNVGLDAKLPELNTQQVQELARRHGFKLTPFEIEKLMEMLGGHPHLLRVAFYKMVREKISLKQILEDAPKDTGIYADYLRLHLWNLEKYPELAQAFRTVVESEQPIELKSKLAFDLNSMGLVYLQGNQVEIRKTLYREYFRDRLKSSLLTLPSTEKRLENLELIPEQTRNILAAIMFTDVKDSAQKHHQNQEPTLAAVFRDLNLMTRLCQQFEGQVLKSVGDGLLMYFVSVVKAVQCAQEIQKTLITAASELPSDAILEHRIGIHLAEVYFNGNDVYGDGVNIAARLQVEAYPRGICISSMVYEAVKRHLGLNIIKSEFRELKGIGSMQVYQISVE
ncbi:AAA-like domain-containing protein [Planktothrix sp. FACHB-1365]|nr:AAA-like domain-containing protein [Planktothrix sp. FACHB-1365]